MKIRNVIVAVSITAALALTPSTCFATNGMLTVAPSSVYQAVKNTSLQDALTKVSTRSGIVFKINAEIGKDVVRQNLSAATWEIAIKSLLQSYNYTLVTDGGVPNVVIVTGQNGSGSGAEPVHVTAAVDPLDYNAPIVINPKMGKLPKAYDSYPAGSVMAIDLPIKEIMGLGKGKTTSFDFPLGQFNVTHDNSVSESDGSTTFVGHMTDEGQGYRMILSQGPAGIMGSFTTPEGNFNIENQNGATVLVDTGKLTHAGFEGDTTAGVIDASVRGAAIASEPIANDAVTLTVSQLTAAVTTATINVTVAKSALTAAQAKLTVANAAGASSLASLNNATAIYNIAKATLGTYTATLAIAQANYAKTTAAYAAANSAYIGAKAALASANTAYNTATVATKAAALVRFTAANNSTNSNYASLLAASGSNATANAAYSQALAGYNTQIGIVQTSSTAVAKANAAYAPALAAITSATVGVTVAQTALTTANMALAKANADLAAATTTYPFVTPSTTAETRNVIDIMVEYATDQVTAAYAKQRIAMLVTASNQAYIDSGIKLTLRLVYSEPTSYPSQNSNADALSVLASSSGVFSTVAAKRAQYGADLVYLFRPLNALTQANCGNAYIEMVSGTAANPDIGYGVISDGTSKDSAPYYYCGINTFTHEIGHNMGLVHDRDNTTVYGATQYSYAWAVTGVGAFGTIMSYGNPIVMYFSTPALAAKTSTGATQTCNGQPCGYAASDARRASDQVLTANATVPIIAKFMPTMIATPDIK
jgi:hypothetical protein